MPASVAGAGAADAEKQTEWRGVHGVLARARPGLRPAQTAALHQNRLVRPK